MRDVAATYDGQGRKHPHKLTFLHYARSMPWLLAGQRIVCNRSAAGM
jgi:hypothetical protein